MYDTSDTTALSTYMITGGSMSNVTSLHGDDPCQTALDFLAVASEYKTGIKRTQPFWCYLSGGVTCDHPKREWMCAEFGINKHRFTTLVYTLVMEGYLDDFYADDTAITLLSIGMLERPCHLYVNDVTDAKALADAELRESEQFAETSAL